MPDSALDGLRVLELAREVAVPYATRLLADLGAEVVKVEPPGGDPLRSWGGWAAADDPTSPAVGGLFEYVNSGKRSVSVDPAGDGPGRLHELLAWADVVVEEWGSAQPARSDLVLSCPYPANPGLSVVHVSPYGREGPFAEFQATDFTVQAAGGWVSLHKSPGTTPVQVGGRIAEFVVGSYVAAATLAAILQGERDGRGVEVDVSMRECLQCTLPYDRLQEDVLTAWGRQRATLSWAVLGLEQCADGWAAVNPFGGLNWEDVCALLEVPEFVDRRTELNLDEDLLAEFDARVRPWFAARSVGEVVALMQALRIPCMPMGTGASLLKSEHLLDREFFVEVPTRGRSLTRPGYPLRLHGTPTRPATPAPALGGDDEATFPSRAQKGPRPYATARAAREHHAAAAGLPLGQLRVLELGIAWAAPYLGCFLGALGADVIKIESVNRPDSFRYSNSFPDRGPDWYEQSPLWQPANLNKRDLTLDLSRREGRELFLRLVEGADAVIENFSVRVLDQFQLCDEDLRAVNPGVILVRMPAFGLTGPLRDYTGWGNLFEEAAGWSTVTGWPDGRPLIPGGHMDAAAAMHAATALFAALRHRRGSSLGQMIEVAQFEAAVCIAAEQITDASLAGYEAVRMGNGHPIYAPQGAYPCQGTNGWLALSIRDDSDWDSLTELMGRPGWAGDVELATVEGRRRARRELDERLADWTRPQDGATLQQLLQAAGLAACEVLSVEATYDDPQLAARGYYQGIYHPISGYRVYPGWPFGPTLVSARQHLARSPLLGEHNEAILRAELGLSDDELGMLAAERIIGTRPSQ